MSFNFIAPHYRWMEFFLAGKKLQRCRTAFLDQVPAAQNILIVGEGNGRFLVECRRQFPSAQITCVDASERMLALARARITRSGLSSERTTFIHADVLAWESSESVADLIVTHFFLDCFLADQIEWIAAKLSRAARPNATWLLADFKTPSAGILKWRARAILKSMYVFFRVVSKLSADHLTPPDKFLQRHGFNLQSRRESEWGLLHTDLWMRSGKLPEK